MANTNVRGIIGYNKQGSTSVNKILVAYENDIVDLAAGTGFGLAHNTSNNSEFEVFLDYVFHQNYTNRPITYGNILSSNTPQWGIRHVSRVPLSKYLKKYKSRLYLGNCKFTGPQSISDAYSDGELIKFPSRVFYSDLFTGGELTWGVEWGITAATVANSPIMQLTTQNDPLASDFKATNIKVGDPFFFTTNASSALVNKTWLVKEVNSAYRLTMTENFPVTDSDGAHFWVGSNWFDVGTDDGDSITGFGENSDRLLIFKLLSLWFYTGSQLKQVKGAPGTSSNRSVINDQYGNTYYFHGSDPKKTGIYKYNGVSSVKVSRAIDPWIRQMAAASYDDVVVWEEEGNKLRFFLGNLTAGNQTETMTNAVATLNVDTNTWTVDPIGDVITCATTFRTSNQQDTYCGTDSSQVLKMNNGNAFKSTPIRFALETKVYYPSGSEIINEYPYLQVIGRSVRGLKVKYKLWDTPTDVDSDWQSLGELEGDKTELTFPQKHNQSSGIQFRFEELGTLENDFLVEKISLFYRPNRTRLL